MLALSLMLASALCGTVLGAPQNFFTIWDLVADAPTRTPSWDPSSWEIRFNASTGPWSDNYVVFVVPANFDLQQEPVYQEKATPTLGYFIYQDYDNDELYPYQYINDAWDCHPVRGCGYSGSLTSMPANIGVPVKLVLVDWDSEAYYYYDEYRVVAESESFTVTLNPQESSAWITPSKASFDADEVIGYQYAITGGLEEYRQAYGNNMWVTVVAPHENLYTWWDYSYNTLCSSLDSFNNCTDANTDQTLDTSGNRALWPGEWQLVVFADFESEYIVLAHHAFTVTAKEVKFEVLNPKDSYDIFDLVQLKITWGTGAFGNANWWYDINFYADEVTPIAEAYLDGFEVRQPIFDDGDLSNGNVVWEDIYHADDSNLLTFTYINVTIDSDGNRPFWIAGLTYRAAISYQAWNREESVSNYDYTYGWLKHELTTTLKFNSILGITLRYPLESTYPQPAEDSSTTDITVTWRNDRTDDYGWTSNDYIRISAHGSLYAAKSADNSNWEFNVNTWNDTRNDVVFTVEGDDYIDLNDDDGDNSIRYMQLSYYFAVYYVADTFVAYLGTFSFSSVNPWMEFDFPGTSLVFPPVYATSEGFGGLFMPGSEALVNFNLTRGAGAGFSRAGLFTGYDSYWFCAPVGWDGTLTTELASYDSESGETVRLKYLIPDVEYTLHWAYRTVPRERETPYYSDKWNVVYSATKTIKVAKHNDIMLTIDDSTMVPTTGPLRVHVSGVPRTVNDYPAAFPSIAINRQYTFAVYQKGQERMTIQSNIDDEFTLWFGDYDSFWDDGFYLGNGGAESFEPGPFLLVVKDFFHSTILATAQGTFVEAPAFVRAFNTTATTFPFGSAFTLEFCEGTSRVAAESLNVYRLPKTENSWYYSWNLADIYDNANWNEPYALPNWQEVSPLDAGLSYVAELGSTTFTFEVEATDATVGVEWADKTYHPDDVIIVNFEAPKTGQWAATEMDWVAIVPAGAYIEHLLDWKYTATNRDYVAQNETLPVTSGQVTFENEGLEPGLYEIQYIHGYLGAAVAVSQPFTVGLVAPTFHAAVWGSSVLFNWDYAQERSKAMSDDIITIRRADATMGEDNDVFWPSSESRVNVYGMSMFDLNQLVPGASHLISWTNKYKNVTFGTATVMRPDGDATLVATPPPPFYRDALMAQLAYNVGSLPVTPNDWIGLSHAGYTYLPVDVDPANWFYLSTGNQTMGSVAPSSMGVWTLGELFAATHKLGSDGLLPAGVYEAWWYSDDYANIIKVWKFEVLSTLKPTPAPTPSPTPSATTTPQPTPGPTMEPPVDTPAPNSTTSITGAPNNGTTGTTTPTPAGTKTPAPTPQTTPAPPGGNPTPAATLSPDEEDSAAPSLNVHRVLVVLSLIVLCMMM